MNELNFIPVNAYIVNDSGESKTLSKETIYNDYNIASTNTKGKGRDGGDAKVTTLANIFTDKDGQLFKVESIGRFVDESDEYKQIVIEGIKSKLTKEELALLQRY